MSSEGLPFLPYGRQTITEADITAVVEVLNSSFLTQGPMVPGFEQAVASKVGASHGVLSIAQPVHFTLPAWPLGCGQVIGSGHHRSRLSRRPTVGVIAAPRWTLLISILLLG